MGITSEAIYGVQNTISNAMHYGSLTSFRDSYTTIGFLCTYIKKEDSNYWLLW